jgi:type VI secretion system protein ImpG
LGGQTLWRLVSHLSLNHRSLIEGPDGIEALQEILRLYANGEDPSIDGQINGLKAVSTRRIVGRVGTDAWRGFCRGTEITLEIDEDAFAAANASPFLLGQVLSQFFGLYTTINSFTQLVIRASRRGAAETRFEAQANGAPLWRWQARQGQTVAQ